MTTLRWGFLLLTVAIPLGCRRDEIEWVQVTVHNTGAVSADVRCEAEYWTRHFWEDHVDFTVLPDRTVEFHLQFNELTRLQVRIYRSTDGLKIFDEEWSREELADLDEHVTLTISP